VLASQDDFTLQDFIDKFPPRWNGLLWVLAVAELIARRAAISSLDRPVAQVDGGQLGRTPAPHTAPNAGAARVNSAWAEIHGDVEDRGRVGEAADREVMDARGRVCLDRSQRQVAGGLELDTVADRVDDLA
jgi:hypothetical protein